MKKIPTLFTDRLMIVPLNASFCSDRYVKWMNDLEVTKYLDSGSNYTRNKLLAYLKQVETKEIYFWAILIAQSKLHIGNIKIDPVNLDHGLGEYGILIGDKKEWGKGFAKEASLAVIDYCFNKLKIRKLTLGVVENNVSAVELYKKMGFITEGYFLNHAYYDGRYCNTLRMSLFNPAMQ
jgi:ribosomal-protein-alanine N-acetyltransferase